MKSKLSVIDTNSTLSTDV